MNKLAFLSLILAVPLFAATPAFATKGIDAARSCVAQGPHSCTAVFDDNGGVTIVKGDTVIQCNGPQEDCHILRTKPVGGSDFDEAPHSLTTDNGSSDGYGGSSGGDGSSGGGHDFGSVHGDFSSMAATSASPGASGGIVQ